MKRTLNTHYPQWKVERGEREKEREIFEKIKRLERIKRPIVQKIR